MIVAILRCFVFCICLISLVPAFKECRKVDQCRCSTDQGIISLWKLVETDKQSRFLPIHCNSPGFPFCKAIWTPCTAFSAGDCHNVAACVIFGNLQSTHFLPIAKQSTATCELSTYGECALKYTGQEASSGYSTSLTVTLICGSGNGTTTSMDSRATDSSNHFKTVLLSKYACPLHSTSASRPTSSSTESSRPVTGFNLLIAFCCVLVVSSFILGTLLYKKTGGRFTCQKRPNVGVQCTADIDKNGYTAI